MTKTYETIMEVTGVCRIGRGIKFHPAIKQTYKDENGKLSTVNNILLEVLKMTKFENNVLDHIHLLERRKRKLENNNPRILKIDERIHSLKRFVDDDD